MGRKQIDANQWPAFMGLYAKIMGIQMTEWQPPSVGRMVHYVSYGTPVKPDGSQAFTSQCRASVITGVKDDTTVSLCVMNPTGLFFHEECYLDGANMAGGTWHWPERV